MTEYDAILNHFEQVDDRFVNLIDLDRLFHTSPKAIILNRIPAGQDYVNRRNSQIFARASSLHFVPRCDCGRLEGLDENRKCPECGTYCRNDFSPSDELEHNAWLSIPPTIPGVLHPIAYIVLSTWLARKGSQNYIDVIIDESLELPPELHGIVLGRGHTYFYENFDLIMTQLLYHFEFVDKKSKTKRDNVPFIRQFIHSYRSVMFCTKLPVMSAVLNSITSSDGTAEGRQYADASLQIILDATTDLQQIEETTMRTRPKAVPGIVHRVYKSYITYVTDIAKNRLSKKESLIRRHILGTRLHFTIRAVIIPHADRYDELYFPWSVSVNLLKLHIIGRLVRKHGMTIGEATTTQVTALLNYDKLIDQIMKDLIDECRPEFPGLPVLFCRNPTLKSSC